MLNSSSNSLTCLDTNIFKLQYQFWYSICLLLCACIFLNFFCHVFKIWTDTHYWKWRDHFMHCRIQWIPIFIFASSCFIVLIKGGFVPGKVKSFPSSVLDLILFDVLNNPGQYILIFALCSVHCFIFRSVYRAGFFTKPIILLYNNFSSTGFAI